MKTAKNTQPTTATYGIPRVRSMKQRATRKPLKRRQGRKEAFVTHACVTKAKQHHGARTPYPTLPYPLVLFLTASRHYYIVLVALSRVVSIASQPAAAVLKSFEWALSGSYSSTLDLLFFKDCSPCRGWGWAFLGGGGWPTRRTGGLSGSSLPPPGTRCSGRGSGKSFALLSCPRRRRLLGLKRIFSAQGCLFLVELYIVSTRFWALPASSSLEAIPGQTTSECIRDVKAAVVGTREAGAAAVGVLNKK